VVGRLLGAGSVDLAKDNKAKIDDRIAVGIFSCAPARRVVRLAPLDGQAEPAVGGQVMDPGAGSGLPGQEIQLPTPCPRRQTPIGRTKFHHAVAVLVAKQTGPGLAARIAGRLEPQRSAEGPVVEIAAQGTAAIHGIALRPGNGTGNDADAFEPSEVANEL